MKRVHKLADCHFNTVVGLRRYFHQYPELSGKEENTAKKICQTLDLLQIPYRRNIAGHGVIAQLQGKGHAHRVIALRADMDALPVQEIANVPYASTIPGVMHACGHDAHMASLLGTLMILNDLKEDFGGVVQAIFQPSEEEYPGGAKLMIEEGVLHSPPTDAIFAQHVTPEIETGCIGIREGAFMASTDEIHIRIIGKGGHAALPHEYINPVEVGIDLLKKIKENIERQNPKEVKTVLAFGKFVADGLTNLIPDSATIAGTLRTFDETWRKEAHNIILETAEKIGKEQNATCHVEIKKGYPVLVNDVEITKRVRKYATELLGKERVLSLPQRTTADDFAYFLQQKSGMLYRLGTLNEKKGNIYRLHSNQFDIDENALLVGMKLMSWITLNELQLR
ncbi:MAG TPA: M20 family metallopeptidase [Bacteroidales bacterium]|nr:M20 family metallopeptidase [Bacteroidales bacterium]